jgi:phosphohistidine phosphatase
MRRLILFRHAKSDWDDPSLPDHERTLAPRGRDAAPRMGAYLARERLVPDRVIVSAARRTRETWALIAKELPVIEDVRLEPRIYEASVDMLLTVVRETLEDAPTLMLVGHNPGLQSLALLVGRRETSPVREAIGRKFPTAAICVLAADYDSWVELMPDTARIERFVTPKSIGAADADD